MNGLKQLVGESRAIFASVLCLLTYAAHAFTITSKTVDAESLPRQTGNVLPFARPALTDPVNNATWAAFKDAQGEAWEIPAGQSGSDPVVNVSKTEIERFCVALNAGGSHSYRLPTVDELAEAFGGDLERDVSVWTCDIDQFVGGAHP